MEPEEVATTASETPIEFYGQHSRYTDPGERGVLFDSIPGDFYTLLEAVQGLLVPAAESKRYGVTIPPERLELVRVGDVGAMLRRLSEEGLTSIADPLPLAKRFPATARHYALLTCSLLRHQGHAARLRQAFSTYLERGKLTQHWVTEYWHSDWERWVVADAQMDAVHRAALTIDFYPLDVPPIRLLPAGEVWTGCRRGDLDSTMCGSAKEWGIDTVKRTILNDFLALNKREVRPDEHAPIGMVAYNALNPNELYLLDQIAEWTFPSVQFRPVRDSFEGVEALRPRPYPELHG